MKRFIMLVLVAGLFAPFFAQGFLIFPTAEITIIKHSVGADATFNFSVFDSDQVQIDNFDIATVTSLGSTQTSIMAFNGMVYSLVENVPAGWQIGNIGCVSQTGQTHFFDISNGISITTNGFDDITCSFTNSPVVQKTPVLIVPGIMGTEIFNGTEKLWPDIGRMLLTNNDRFMDPLAYNDQIDPIDSNLSIGEVLGKPSLKFDYTDKLINDLSVQGYQTNVDLFTFPYDWRKDLDSVAQNELKQKIDDILSQTGSNKIDIIAHSQGGLVVKRLLYDQTAYQSKVDKLVFVAAPNLGAPKAAKALLYGDSMSVSLLGLGLDPGEVQRIGQNIPAVYELLPSLEYFSHGNAYLGVARTFGPFITGYSILNYTDTKQTLKDLGLNSSLVDQAENFHTPAYDNYNFNSSGMQVSNIVGCQEGTISLILDGQDGRFWLSYGPGDGTVPVVSASNIFGSNDYFAKKSNHGTMLTDDGTRQLLVNLISGSSLSTGNVITSDPTQCKFNGKVVSVHSPVELNIYDEDGNHVGPNASGNTDMEIPGVQYDVLGTDKFAFLPDGHTYTVELNATDNGSFDFYSSNISDGVTTETSFYNDVAITNSSNARIDLTNDSEPIQLDLDGNGTIDQSINPSAILDTQQSNDLINPVTSAIITGTVGQPGFYRSNISVSLPATDDNSDVLNTKYNLDGAGYQTYFGVSIPVTTEGPHTVKFFSIDNAGNNEAEKSLSFTIDKIAPELFVKFDPIKVDLIFTSPDGVVSDNDDAVTATDLER